MLLGLTLLPAVSSAHTPVSVRLEQEISSDKVSDGDHFSFSIAADVVVDGHVIVPAGSTGTGDVIHARPSGSMGRAGELVLAARSVLVDGKEIPLHSLAAVGSAADKSTNTVIEHGDALILPRGALLSAALETADAPKGEGHGTVIFFRPKRSAANGLKALIKENENTLAVLTHGTYAIIEVPVGVHHFVTQNYDQVALEVEAGETYYVRSGFVMNIGFTPSRSNLAPSTRADFEQNKHELKEITPK